MFVVKPDNTVERRSVEVAEARGSMAALAAGLKAGEKVDRGGPAAAQSRHDRDRQGAPGRRRGRKPHRASGVEVSAMNISETFIRRPVATILLSVALTFAGLFAYRFLPVAALPTVDFPTISVSAQLPGASPDTMADLGRHAADQAILDHPGDQHDQRDQLPGLRPRSRSSSSWTATSTRRRPTCSRRSRARCASCRPR